MVAIKNIAASFLLVLLLPGGRAVSAAFDRATLSDSSLFAQSAAAALSHDFPDPNVSYLLLDATSGRLLASRWNHPETPIPMGSLVKPFTALAYGERHEFHYPRHICQGTASGCWRPRGHGEIDLSAAIAYSCNSYFRMLTANLNAADVTPIAERFAFEPPGSELAGAELAGLGARWRISPLRLARAYLQLIHQRRQPGVSEVLDGMWSSGRSGTGKEVHRALPFRDAMVKTGTAACTHSARAPGDGFTVALVPADQPRFLLLVRVHGVPGALAAKTAGLMLRRIEE